MCDLEIHRIFAVCYLIGLEGVVHGKGKSCPWGPRRETLIANLIGFGDTGSISEVNFWASVSMMTFPEVIMRALPNEWINPLIDL